VARELGSDRQQDNPIEGNEAKAETAKKEETAAQESNFLE